MLFLIVPMMVSAQNRNVIVKSDGSITFVVDEDLPQPKHKLWMESANDVAAGLLSELDYHYDYSVVATSINDDSLMDIGKDVLYQCVIEAYIDHRPIVLTPDVIWITICQGFSKYVNAHSEKLRPLLVSHDGKQTLTIKTQPLPSGKVDWESVVDGFSVLIGENTKNDVAKIITADFSTTERIERIASEITLMDCVKDYFDYKVFMAACGIPNITLKGTPDDWRRVLEKTRSLAQFGLEKWVAKLEPVLSEFVRAAEGKPRQYFWRSIVKYYNPDDNLRGPSCAPGSEPPEEIDGWILKFYPNTKGKVKRQVKWTDNMSPNQVCVPFKCKVVNDDNAILSEYDMYFVAGVVSARVDANTGALEPMIGWVVGSYKDNGEREREGKAQKEFDE